MSKISLKSASVSDITASKVAERWLISMIDIPVPRNPVAQPVPEARPEVATQRVQR